MTLFTSVCFALVAILLFFLFLNDTIKPKIKGIPAVPGVPIFGNLIQLGDSYAETTRKWAEKFGPVFQLRLGNKYVIIANSFESARTLWITSQASLVSRPILHTFNNVINNCGKQVCSTENFNLAASPWDVSLQKRKKAVASALNGPKVQSYMPLVAREINDCIRDLTVASRNSDVDVKSFIQRISLNMSLTLNYGVRLNDINGDLFKEIVHVESQMAIYRSSSANWQDYIPILRLWPGRSNNARAYKARQLKYLETLLGMLRENIKLGIDEPCITGSILKEEKSSGLNEAEIRSLGASVIAGGLDTLPANLIMTIGYFTSAHGTHIQQRAYEEITTYYPNGDAWERCLEGMHIPYINAMVKEVLRYWSVIPINLPRVNISDIDYNGAKIPAGTTFLLNTYAANHDPTFFTAPSLFHPERYLPDAPKPITGTAHFSYGAGLRMCSGYQLANRELYTFLVRFLLAFEVVPPHSPVDYPVLDLLGCNATPTSLTLDTKPFKVGLRVREKGRLEEWLGEGGM